MSEVTVTLVVLFEEPFWIGLFTRMEDGRLSVSKVTFGAEPKEYEVSDHLQQHYYQLKFSPAVPAEGKKDAKNPKRRQREVRKQLQRSEPGTKSQQALKLQHEQMKAERRSKSRQQKEAEKQLKFQLKQQKKKEKHKGK